MRRTLLTVALVATTTLSACTSQPPKRAKWTGAIETPPAYPAAQTVPVDAALRTAAAGVLAKAERSESPYTRAHAIEGYQETKAAGANKAVLRGLSDDSAVVRFAAAMAAGQLAVAEAKPQLLKMVNDPDANVQVGVRFALHKLGDTRHSHDFEKLAFAFDPEVRGNTALALGMLGNPSALKILQKMKNEQNIAVRLQVLESRWRLGDESALQDLVTGTVSKFADDQLVCYLALAAPHDQRVSEHVRGGLISGYPEVALASARSMGELGSDEGYGVATRACKSNDPRQRALAAHAFGSIGRTDAQPMLAELLKDTDEEVRLAAATALLRFK